MSVSVDPFVHVAAAGAIAPAGRTGLGRSLFLGRG